MDPELIGSLTGLFGVMIPLVAIALGIALAFWAVYWGHQKRRLQYQERQLMIEKGLTPPPVMPDERKRVSPEDCLRRGIILLALGIGLAVASLAVLANFSNDRELVGIVAVAGAIVGSLGLGNLVYYFVARNRPVAEPTAHGQDVAP